MAAKRTARKKTVAKKAPRKTASAAPTRKRPSRKKAAAKRRTQKRVGEVVYGPEIRDEIIDWICEGKTLREYCRQPGKPSFKLVYLWLEKEADGEDSFATRFARARQIQEQVLLEQCFEIAEDGSNDWMERLGKDEQPLGWMLNKEHVQRSKLRIHTRLELLKRMNPARWGDRVAIDSKSEARVEHSGKVENAGPPLPDPEAFAAHLAQVAELARGMGVEPDGADAE